MGDGAFSREIMMLAGNVLTIVIIAAVTVLSLLSFLALRRMRRNGIKAEMKHEIQHKEIRQEIEIGDKKLEVRIQLLEKR